MSEASFRSWSIPCDDQAADVWNSLCDLEFLSLVCSRFIQRVLSKPRCFILLLFLGFLLLVCGCLNTHIPALYKLTPDLRSKSPSVSTRTILTLSALLRSTRRKAICPPSLPPSFSLSNRQPLLSFLSLKDEKKNPILHSQEAWLFLLPFFVRFIHPQCLAPAISSPPTLTPTLYSLYKLVCVHLLLPQAGKGFWGGGSGDPIADFSLTGARLNADSWYFLWKISMGNARTEFEV